VPYSSDASRALRRTSYNVAIEAHERVHGRELTLAVLEWSSGMDAVWLAAWLILLTVTPYHKETLAVAQRLGLQHASKEQWLDQTKNLTAIVKKWPKATLRPFGLSAAEAFEDYELFTSWGVLTGFATEVRIGDDPWQDARDLVSTAEAKSSWPLDQIGPSEDNYLAQLGRNLENPPLRSTPKNKQLTLEQYIDDAKNWATSGAAGGERVEDTAEDTALRYTKRFLAEAYTTEALTERVIARTPLRAKAVIKSEAEKMRPVTQADWESHILLGYLIKTTAAWTDVLSGTSLNETNDERLVRYGSMIESLHLAHFPWDYRQFDHQLTSAEETLIYRNMQSSALTYGEWELWRLWIFRRANATLEVDGAILPAPHGLISGIRSTSTVGTQWNLANARLAGQVLSSVFGVTGESFLLGTGDDTDLARSNAAACVLLYLIYRATNLKGSRLKMYIAAHTKDCARTDFLRETVRTSGVRGIMPRAILAVVQRKPISSAPVSPEAEAATVIASWGTVKRRGGLPSACDWMRNKLLELLTTGPNRTTYLTLARTSTAWGGWGSLPPRPGTHGAASTYSNTRDARDYSAGWYYSDRLAAGLRQATGLPGDGKYLRDDAAFAIIDYEADRLARQDLRDKAIPRTTAQVPPYETLKPNEPPLMPAVSISSSTSTGPLLRWIHLHTWPRPPSPGLTNELKWIMKYSERTEYARYVAQALQRHSRLDTYRQLRNHVPRRTAISIITSGWASDSWLTNELGSTLQALAGQLRDAICAIMYRRQGKLSSNAEYTAFVNRSMLYAIKHLQGNVIWAQLYKE